MTSRVKKKGGKGKNKLHIIHETNTIDDTSKEMSYLVRPQI